MRKWLRSKLPTRDSINQQSSLRRVRHFLQHPNLWSLNRKSVARGATVGVVVALIPIPLQMLIAAIMAIVFRANLPIAVILSLVSNPFTFVPINYLIYQIGMRIVGNGQVPASEIPWNFDSLQSSWDSLIAHFGKVYLVGLSVTMLLAGCLAYLTVNIIWRINIYLQLRARKRRGTRKPH